MSFSLAASSEGKESGFGGAGLFSEERMGPLNRSPLITHDYKGAPRSTWSADAIQVLLEPLSQETVCNFTSLQTSVTNKTH